jgi:hypothetical protein
MSDKSEKTGTPVRLVKEEPKPTESKKYRVGNSADELLVDKDAREERALERLREGVRDAQVRRVVLVDEDGNEVAPPAPPAKPTTYATGKPTAWSARVDEDTLAEDDAEASADVGDDDIVLGTLRLVPSRAYEVWRFESMTKGSRLVGLVAPTGNGWSFFSFEVDGYQSPEEAAEVGE